MSGGGQTTKQTQTQKTSNKGTSKPLYGGPELKGLAQAGGNVTPTDLSGYVPQVQSYIDSTLNGTSNPHLGGLLSSLESSARNTVGSAFSAAGRSFSPSHASALGTALTNAEAPYLFSNYQNERAALPGLFGMAAGLPFAGMGAQRDFLLPIAAAGSKTTGNSTGTSIGATIGPSGDPFQTALGAGLGGIGALGATGAFPSAGLGASSAGWLGPALAGMFPFPFL